MSDDARMNERLLRLRDALEKVPEAMRDRDLERAWERAFEKNGRLHVAMATAIGEPGTARQMLVKTILSLLGDGE